MIPHIVFVKTVQRFQIFKKITLLSNFTMSLNITRIEKYSKKRRKDILFLLNKQSFSHLRF